MAKYFMILAAMLMLLACSHVSVDSGIPSDKDYIPDFDYTYPDDNVDNFDADGLSPDDLADTAGSDDDTLDDAQSDDLLDSEMPDFLGPDDIGAMVDIPAGDFLMGCNWSVDDECFNNEKPKHTVTMRAYKINKYEG